MIQLSSKELRFGNAAIAAMQSSDHKSAWAKWYAENVENTKSESGMYNLPGNLTNILREAISNEKRRISILIEQGKVDDPELINDFEIYLNIEVEIKQRTFMEFSL